jgi:hypothetical protein
MHFFHFLYQFPISNLYLIFDYNPTDRMHTTECHTSHDCHNLWCNITPVINLLMFSHYLHPHSYSPLFPTIQNYPELPQTQKAMLTTSSMIPLLHHSLLILLFHLCSHDQVPHRRVSYLLSPHDPFSQIPIPHYNWMITIFLLLYEPFTYST